MHLETAIEAILFASGDPVSIEKISEVLGVSIIEVEKAANKLKSELDFSQRGIKLVKLDDMLQLITRPELADVIRSALEERRPLPLSKAAIEVLCITAYYGPVTKAVIERLRGVECGATINNLCVKGLICEAGRSKTIGKPRLYKTTPDFLRTFGLESLSDLPPFDDPLSHLQIPIKEKIEFVEETEEIEV